VAKVKKPKIDKGKGASKSSDDCLLIAQKSLHMFDHSELKEYMSNVFEKATQYKDLGSNAALKQALKETQSDIRQSLLGRCATKANNISKFEHNTKILKEKKIKSYSLLRGSAKNKGHNVENAQSTRRHQLMNFMFDDLTKEETQYLINPENQIGISEAYDTGRFSNQFEKKLSEKLKSYFQFQKETLVESNAMPIEFLNEDRYFGNLHDRNRILAGGRSMADSAISIFKGNKYGTEGSGSLWREFIKTKVNIEKMFRGSKARNDDGSINMEEVDRILDNTYVNITENRSEIFTKSVAANDREAVEKKSRQFFVWKGMREAMEYSEEYGSGNLFQELIKDLNMTANKSGMADIFGDNPYSMLNDVKKFAQKNTEEQASSAKHTDNIFNQVMGQNHLSVDPTINNFIRAQSTLTSMARLGTVALQSISDISNSAGAIYRQGFGTKGFIETAFANVKNIFNNPLMKSDARRHMANIFKTDIDTMIGYMAKFNESNIAGNWIDKLGNKFYYWTGTKSLENGIRHSTLEMLANLYGRETNKTFDKLTAQNQYIWKQHNLTPDEWEVLKKHSSLIGGKKLWSVDSVDKVSIDDIRSLWEKSDKSVSFSSYKNSLYRNVYSLFNTTVENAIINPGAFEKMSSTWGGVGGIPGLAIKSFMQFKSYPLGLFRKTFYEAYKDMQGPQAKLLYAAHMIVMTAPLAYASQWLGYAVKGMTMPDFEDMNANQKLNFLIGLMAPGVGMFMTILDPKKQNHDMALNFLATPSIKLLGNELATVAKIGTGALTGNFQGLDNRLVELLGQISPIATVPGIEPYFDKLLDKKPYLQPGQEQYGWAQ